MTNYLSRDLTNTVYGFAGIYGVEIMARTQNYVTEEMQKDCNDDIWIMVENNLAKENTEYNYKLKCLYCGIEITTNEIQQYNVIIPVIKEKLIPYVEIRDYAKNLIARYSAKIGAELSMEVLYDRIVQNYCIA